MSNREAGKGDAPRKQQDHEKYCHNWEVTFGKKEKKDEQPKEKKQNN